VIGVPKPKRGCTQCGNCIPRASPGGQKQGDKGYSARLFCSRKCSHYSMRRVATVACKMCGVAIGSGKRSVVLGRLFCSKACRALHEQRRVVKSCLHCSNPIRPLKRSHAEKRRFCSTKCWYSHRKAKPKAAPNPCPVCGNPMLGYKLLTCSAACGYVFRKQKTRKIATCKECRKEFWPTWCLKVFCSRSCYTSSVGRCEAILTVQCHGCGTAVKRTTAAVKRVAHVFCSRICRVSFHTGANSPAWRGGSDPNRGAGWRKLADEARARDGRCCRRCGKTEAENGQKLSVDHLIPWRLFSSAQEANQLSNLVSLCRSCHAIKTQVAERQYLKGDVLAMRSYERSVSLPSLVGE